MGRFTYLRYDWPTLAGMASAQGHSLSVLANWFCVPPDTQAAWRTGQKPIPTWFAVGTALLWSRPIGAIDEPELHVAMRDWGTTSRTLARLWGLNPETIRHWRNGERPTPPHVARLLGLMAVPGAMSRTRAIAATLIETDKEQPGVLFPFLGESV